MRKRKKSNPSKKKLILYLDSWIVEKIDAMYHAKKRKRTLLIEQILKNALGNESIVSKSVAYLGTVPLHTCEDALIGDIKLDKGNNFFYKKCSICGDDVEVYSSDPFIKTEELEKCRKEYGKIPGKELLKS